MLPALLLLWKAKEAVWLGEEKQTSEGTCLEEAGVESHLPGPLASLLAQNSKFLLVLGALIFGVSGLI